MLRHKLGSFFDCESAIVAKELNVSHTTTPTVRPWGPELGKWMPPYTLLLAISMAALLKELNLRGFSSCFGYSLPISNVTLSVPKYLPASSACVCVSALLECSVAHVPKDKPN